MNHTRHAMAARPQREMLEKAHLHDTFFGLKNAGHPERNSVLTEFMMESDWDEDDILSELEDSNDIVSEGDECENSPRVSVHSSGQPSITTLSSYEEAHTPQSARARSAYNFEIESLQQVEGPRGPHLFRSSSLSLEYQDALSLSPVTPRAPKPKTADFHYSLPPRRRDSTFQFTGAELDTSSLPQWSPEKVAQWMLNAGVEIQFAEKFVENDINGAILITLKFEDLKELGIGSFGVRTKIWEEIHIMRDIRLSEPAPETPIEDEPSREVRREQRRLDDDGTVPKRGQSNRRRKSPKPEDTITPLESVSIVGIEQMMPKPHQCSKGKKCRKWQRNQRMIEAFKKDHPYFDVNKGGFVMVAGDPGNPETAHALNQPDDIFRPVSDAIPSVIASSDILGPGIPPLQYLQEASLRNIQARDPQDNVLQFLNFQHQGVEDSSEVPPTPPFEVLSARNAPHEGLRSLPKLSIPGGNAQRQDPGSACPGSACPGSAYPVSAYPQTAIPSEIVEEEQATPTGVYRFGTPFSEMDVPVTAVALGPIARDFSQSVPPDMNFRPMTANPPVRSMSRSSHRRPSFPVLPALNENSVTSIAPRRPSPPSPQSQPKAAAAQRPLQAPPRVQYPWSQQGRTFETAIAPLSATTPISTTSSNMSPLGGATRDAEGVSYQGHMKKRKTKMLRHEWHDHFVTLKGTRLNVHKDAQQVDRTLEYIDIDDYAIACSSLASSKLNAAFKAMSIRKDKHAAGDVAAFSFQLIPQDGKGGVKLLRKRESALPSSASLSSGHSGSTAASSSGLADGANGTGKTHHFAVKSRDDRIDWMRELMLAKALKQKGEGFEVSVNGNMI